MSDRIAIVYALEAIEDGNQRHAAEILLAALEDGPVRPDPKANTLCGFPGCTFTGWPGEVDAHFRRAHGFLPARRFAPTWPELEPDDGETLFDDWQAA